MSLVVSLWELLRITNEVLDGKISGETRRQTPRFRSMNNMANKLGDIQTATTRRPSSYARRTASTAASTLKRSASQSQSHSEQER
jgi:hypothetical protein